MIEQACVAIDRVAESDRANRVEKYARRNKMRYIDQLLNELEMLNLADQPVLPRPLVSAVGQLLAESPEVVAQPRLQSVVDAMEALYEIQDSLMFNQIEDE